MQMNHCPKTAPYFIFRVVCKWGFHYTQRIQFDLVATSKVCARRCKLMLDHCVIQWQVGQYV